MTDIAHPVYAPGTTITAGELLALARARALNRTARQAAETQATVGGNNSLVPIVFGQQRVGGRIAAITVSDHLYVAVVWCTGEVDSVVSVTINDEALPAGVTATHYTGTAGQTTDATMAAKIAGFADAMVGICYSVFNCRPGKFSGFPRFAAVIKGLKVPLTSGGAATWTQNGAYLLAAMIENATWGMGKSVDWATVATVAAANDALVGGEKKRILNLVIDTSRPASEWLQSVADYAGCWVVPEGAGYRLVADAVASSVKSFTSANIVQGSLSLDTRSILNRPTMIEVSYTDTSYQPYRESRYTSSPATPRILSRISRPGITRYSEAKRYATERLNESTVNDKTITFRSFDDCLALQIGDVVDVTHPIGLSAATYRVLRRTPVEYGRWEIEATRYDSGKYDSSVVSGPTTPDTSTGGPNNPPTITGGVLTEVTFQTENGLYLSRLQATWDEPTWPYTSGYKVSFAVSDNGGPDPEYLYTDIFVTDGTTTYSSPITVAAGSLAIVYVSIISITGVVGTGTRVDLIGGIVGAAAITNKRIKANFSGAVADKTFLQTNVANSASSVGVLPNGSGAASSVYTYNAADAANSSICQFGISSSTAYLGSAISGTGSQLPLGLYVAGTLWAEGMTTGWRWKFSSKSGAPTTGDIASGYSMVWKDTGSGAVYLYVNDGGTLKKVQLT